MMKALGDASTRSFLLVSEDTEVDWDAHFCHNPFSIWLAHSLKAESLAHECLRETAVSLSDNRKVPPATRTKPPVFRTLQTIGWCTENENQKKRDL